MKRNKTSILLVTHSEIQARLVWPASNEEYWGTKLLGNIDRDKRNFKSLGGLGWHVVAWECE